jgi:hypothetical protein
VDRLVKISVVGEVASPVIGKSVYRVSPTGIPRILPGVTKKMILSMDKEPTTRLTCFHVLATKRLLSPVTRKGSSQMHSGDYDIQMFDETL